MFITFEGVDGSGKSTQVKLLAEALERERAGAVRLIREPGGTPVAERVREIVADPELQPASVSELLLFGAARADLVEAVIRPALADGEVVICDRFADSTVAYQGAARGVPAEIIQALNTMATHGLKPDITLYMRIEPELALPRAKSSDRFEAEGLEFQRAVSAAYDEIATSEPERVQVIDASASIETIHREVRAALSERGL